MNKDVRDRSISSGVRHNIHGILIDEVWKAWDKVKKTYKTKDDFLVLVEVRTNKAPNNRVRIRFITEQTEQKFYITSAAGKDAELVIFIDGKNETMILKSEFEKLLKECEDHG